MNKTSTLLIGLSLFFTACSTTPPTDINNICNIFDEKGGWYRQAAKSQKSWGVPIPVLMAIMRQESSFKAKVKPPRGKLLGIIPWFRSSSAFGYAQVKDGTWSDYIRATSNGGADRDDFGDAVDFIGWYGAKTHRLLGVSKWDAYGQYLAYHEGHGGYRAKSYRKKAWLVKVAKKVKRQSQRYSAQFKKCQKRLESAWDFWPFW